ncbi:MAG TPA: hypothetical protein PLP34_08715 [Chitinophagaceae bacterium]|nr:hypothetical protein [Chitinophagaceae bacterium]
MKILLPMLLLFSTTSFSQTSLVSLSGKWKEDQRTTRKGMQLEFDDTLHLEIQTSGFLMLRYPGSETFTSACTLKEDYIQAGKLKFTFDETNGSVLWFQDKDGRHRFQKITESSFTTAPRILPGVEKGNTLFDYASVHGRWSCYKKTDPAYRSSTFYIRSLDFKTRVESGSYQGEATFNNADSVFTVPAILQFNQGELQVESAGGLVKARVLKSDGEEMILEQGSVHYFLKRFGK